MLINQKWKIDLSILNTKLPESILRPPVTIILEPIHGLYFEDGEGVTRSQRVNEIPIAPTQHLINLPCYMSTESNQHASIHTRKDYQEGAGRKK